MALKHLSVTQQAAKTVMAALKQFKSKKRSYMLQYKNGDIDRTNNFLAMLDRVKMVKIQETALDSSSGDTDDYS